MRRVFLRLAAALMAMPVASAAAERLNPLIERLEAGEPAYGIFSGDRDVLNAGRLGRSGLDYIIIDMEHGPFDVEALRRFILAMKGADGTFSAAPIVRIPANGREVHHNQWMVKQVLDAGAMGIMIPHINNPEEARESVVAMRYPPRHDAAAPEPRGERGWGPISAIAAWGVDFPTYARLADLWPLNPDGELLLVVQIETLESVDSAEEILTVPGVGAAFLGPADLHADMGYLGESGVAEVEAAIDRAAKTAGRLAVPIGITTNPDTVAQRLEQGFGMSTVGFDLALPAGIAESLQAVGR